MNTPTHLLINWSLAGPAARRLGKASFPSSAVLLGSVAPDLPLFALTLGGIAWYGGWKQWPAQRVGQHLFDQLFFHDPWWISLHHVLHSPTVCIAVLLMLLAIHGRDRVIHSWWTWFMLSCLAHTLVDIPVHHDDGPLIFWPLNWSFRYASPISYWDPRHYGHIVAVLEGILFLLLSARLVYFRLRRQSSRSG